MVKDINLSKRIQLMMKVIITFSSSFLSLLLSRNIFVYDNNIYTYLLPISLSFITMAFLISKVSLEKINTKALIISIIISMYLMKYFMNFSSIKLMGIISNMNLGEYKTYLCSAIGIFAFPSLVLFIYLFIKYIIPKVISFLKGLTKVEKKYLLIYIVIGFLVMSILSFLTTGFTNPTVNGYGIESDVIYTTDTYSLVNNDAFINISHFENDIRQPLFGVFALPFGLMTRIISEVLFFLPVDSYGFSLMFIQFILIALTNIIIVRLLKTKEKDKKYLYLLFGVSYPYMVFTLTVEQYVVALFYLVLAIYIYDNSKKVNHSYVASVGTLLTSGVIFPLISHANNIKDKLKDVFKTFILFLMFMIFSGGIIQVLYLKEEINHIMRFSNGIGLEERIYQFSNFVKGIFLSSSGSLKEIGHTSYQLLESNSIDIIGIIILALMVISFILNRKNKMALISFLWVLFSVILLCLIGWGTAENGLVLYSLYFAWSYLVLYYLLLRKLFKKENLFRVFYYSSVIVMGICGIGELFNLLGVMINYY